MTTQSTGHEWVNERCFGVNHFDCLPCLSQTPDLYRYNSFVRLGSTTACKTEASTAILACNHTKSNISTNQESRDVILFMQH